MTERRLEDEGNPFAGLVWVALQSRIVEAAIFGAIIPAVAVADALSMQKKAPVDGSG